MEEINYNLASIPTVRRLPIYLHLLKEMQKDGREFISSTIIAEKLKLEAIQIRKDLQSTGIEGKPKIGYYVSSIIEYIEKFLGWDNNTEAFMVGVGSLGSALLGYDGFAKCGLDIVAAFDNDNAKIGSQIRGKEVIALDKLPDLAVSMGIKIGIITVPADEAQVVCDIMVASGILAIWNFTPTNLEIPDEVVVQNEDLSCGLAVLSVKLSKILLVNK